MHQELSPHTVHKNATVREAMAAIDVGSTGVVMILGGNDRLEGLMTDGDLRRMLLAGAEMSSHAVAWPLACLPGPV